MLDVDGFFICDVPAVEMFDIHGGEEALRIWFQYGPRFIDVFPYLFDQLLGIFKFHFIPYPFDKKDIHLFSVYISAEIKQINFNRKVSIRKCGVEADIQDALVAVFLKMGNNGIDALGRD